MDPIPIDKLAPVSPPRGMMKSVEHATIVAATNDGTQRMKAIAFRRYMYEDRTYKDIAEELGVPERTVVRWSHTDRWATRRESMIAEAAKDAETRLREFIINKRLIVAMEEEAIADNLEKLINNAVAKMAEAQKEGAVLKTNELKQLAEALSSASSVRVRPVGLTDGVAAAVAAPPPAPQNQSTLLVIGVRPVQPGQEPRIPETLDAEVVEDE